jgi:transposase
MLAKMPISVVSQLTGMAESTIYYLIKNAKQRGYNPDVDPRILERYVVDSYRSSCPKEISESQDTKQSIIKSVTKDRARREKSSEYLAFEASISQTSVLRILKRSGLSCVKPSYKPGLTNKARKRRLQFCLEHADCTLED